VHPISIEVALGAALWFITVTWVGFARGGEIDWDLVVMTLFFIGFFALFLLAASYAVKDKRWHLPSTSFHQFLDSPVGTATGTMRGRDALIEIAMVPVSLALAATVIAIVVMATH
jgi:hypothetical protein